MIGNNMEEFIFTFGDGHPHRGKCVRIQGDYETARKKMVDKFGYHWAFQYTAEEWDKMKTDKWYGEFLEKEVPFDELD